MKEERRRKRKEEKKEKGARKEKGGRIEEGATGGNAGLVEHDLTLMKTIYGAL